MNFLFQKHSKTYAFYEIYILFSKQYYFTGIKTIISRILQFEVPAPHLGVAQSFYYFIGHKLALLWYTGKNLLRYLYNFIKRWEKKMLGFRRCSISNSYTFSAHVQSCGTRKAGLRGGLAGAISSTQVKGAQTISSRYTFISDLKKLFFYILKTILFYPQK